MAKQTINYWLKEDELDMISKIDKNKKVTKKEFDEIIKDEFVFTNKYNLR